MRSPCPTFDLYCARAAIGVVLVVAGGLGATAALAATKSRHTPRPVAALPADQLAPVSALPDTAAPPLTETLAGAIAEAYRSNPTLQAQRYDLRATDEGLGLALSALRPSANLQVTGQYNKTVPGQTTQATRFGAASPIITSNSLNSQLIISQPISTGGKASADIAAARASILAGRAALRADEGDLLLQTVTAYLDVRRDTAALAIREANLAQLRATLDEVKARRTAGELTRTDIAQAETQLDSAEANTNLQREQLEQSRATYAALVGHVPGTLAPAPPLPQVPSDADAAYAQATLLNPELDQARMTEQASRARVVAARAANHPTLSLQATAGLTGQATPFYLHNEDQGLTVQGVLTIPLTAGGHNGALTGQALATNSADRLRIEAAQRAMIRNIVNAWNQITTARRNVAVTQAQQASAQIFYEGTFAEYRAGLRSTFDVLYAQGTLRDTAIALTSAQHDQYIAEATLLRHVGLLEVRNLVSGVSAYDPSVNTRHSARRSATPWDGAVRFIDGYDQPKAALHPIDPVDPGGGAAALQPRIGPPSPDQLISIDPARLPPAPDNRADPKANQ